MFLVSDERVTGLGSRAGLLDAAPWLGSGLTAAERRRVNAAFTVPLVRLERGPQPTPPHTDGLGYIVTEGLLAVKLHLSSCTSTAIVGPGEFLYPADVRCDSGPLGEERSVVALTGVELVAVDRRLWLVGARFPAVGDALMEALEDRLHITRFLLGLHQLARVEERVWLALWHLAVRHGRVTGRGVLVELPRVTHQLLAELVAARRPSVTVALRRLGELGLVRKVGRDGWLLGEDAADGITLLGSRRCPEPAD